MENIKTNGFNWTLIKKDSIAKGILEGRHWEPHLTNFIKEYLKEGNCAVDVGACFGWHTLEMSRMVGKDGVVYAFEPQPDNLGLLNKNIAQNLIENVVVYPVGLGHKNMAVCMWNAYWDDEKNLGDSFISATYHLGIKDKEIPSTIHKGGRELPINKEIVTCKTLDSLALSRKIDFIKIDVQGFEKMVLEGGSKTIEKDRPVMVIEFENPCLFLFGYSSKELFQYLFDLKYKVYFLEHEYPCDHVCVPEEQVEEFERKFSGKIFPHNQDNFLNNNIMYGINRKIVLL